MGHHLVSTTIHHEPHDPPDLQDQYGAALAASDHRRLRRLRRLRSAQLRGAAAVEVGEVPGRAAGGEASKRKEEVPAT